MANYPKFEEFAENYSWEDPKDPAKHFSDAEKEAPKDKDDLNASAVKGRHEEKPVDGPVQAEEKTKETDESVKSINEMRAIAGLVAVDKDGHDEIARKNASAEAGYDKKNNATAGIPSLPPMVESDAKNFVIIDRRTGRQAKVNEETATAIHRMLSVIEGKQFQAAADHAGMKAGKTYNVTTAVGNSYQLVEVGTGKTLTVTAGDLMGVAAPYPSK